MSVLTTAKVLHASVQQAACRRRTLPAWAPAASRRRQHQQRRLAAQASQGSSAISASNGWLLDNTSSLPAPSSSSSSGGNGNGSSALGSNTPGSNGSSSNSYDAIMMLGGGLLPSGGLPDWVERRLEGCLHLYQQQLALQAASETSSSSSRGGASGPGQSQRQQQRRWPGADPAGPGSSGACPVVLLGAGTPHKPPVIGAGGYVLHESTAYADFLLQRGIPAGDLLKEAQSYDTIGNAYFSLLQHALPAGWRRIAVVTSEFHMHRTYATFDFIYQLAGRQLHRDPAWYCLDYRPVSDEGIFAAGVLEARAAKEAAAVATWQHNTAGMASLADLHAWLYATHLCYSVSRQNEFGREQDLDPKLAATY